MSSVIGKPWPGFILTALRLLKRIDGDIIIACKPRPASFGIALIKQLISRVPVILDIDDDEIAITRISTGKGRWLSIGHPKPGRTIERGASFNGKVVRLDSKKAGSDGNVATLKSA